MVKKAEERSKMIALKTTYSYNTDETKLSFGKEFETLPLIHQLDAIQDSLALIEAAYQERLEKFHKGNIE